MRVVPVLALVHARRLQAIRSAAHGMMIVLTRVVHPSRVQQRLQEGRALLRHNTRYRQTLQSWGSLERQLFNIQLFCFDNVLLPFFRSLSIERRQNPDYRMHTGTYRLFLRHESSVALFSISLSFSTLCILPRCCFMNIFFFFLFISERCEKT